MTDQRRRQKRIAKKAAKRKARLERKRESQSNSSVDRSSGVIPPAGYPVHESAMSSSLFNLGIGNVVLSRQAGARLIVSVFLVDVFCLGVKDAFHAVLLERQYIEMKRRFPAEQQLVPIHPTCLRKLVEGAVTYAEELGIAPHQDYFKARRIFLDLEPEACPTSFEYGKDGKPFYVAGPYDSTSQSKRIVNLLTKRCGPDGFHYLLPLA